MFANSLNEVVGRTAQNHLRIVYSVFVHSDKLYILVIHTNPALFKPKSKNRFCVLYFILLPNREKSSYHINWVGWKWKLVVERSFKKSLKIIAPRVQSPDVQRVT